MSKGSHKQVYCLLLLTDRIKKEKTIQHGKQDTQQTHRMAKALNSTLASESAPKAFGSG